MIDCSVDRTLEKSCHGSACFRAVFLHVYQEIRFVVDLILYSNMWLGIIAQCLEVTDYTVYVFPLNLDICQCLERFDLHVYLLPFLVLTMMINTGTIGSKPAIGKLKPSAGVRIK